MVSDLGTDGYCRVLMASLIRYMRDLVMAAVPLPESWLVQGPTTAPLAHEAFAEADEADDTHGAPTEADVPLHLQRLLRGQHERSCTVDAARGLLLDAWDGRSKLVVKQCNAPYGTLSVERFDTAAAVERALALASRGGSVLLQPDLHAHFAAGETRVCVQLPPPPTVAGGNEGKGRCARPVVRVLGAWHAPSSAVLGIDEKLWRLLSPDELPEALRRVAVAAGEVLLAHASSIGVTAPPVVRVDCIELPPDGYVGLPPQSGRATAASEASEASVVVTRWCVNGFELADEASWQWGWACRREAAAAMDEAVCEAHALWIERELRDLDMDLDLDRARAPQ